MRYHQARLQAKHHVFLVPGFFGFNALGAFEYWGHVRTLLAELAAKGGIDLEVSVVGSHPTSSLLARAMRLAGMIRERAGENDAIHLIGHSSGGLDARLMIAPGVDIGADVEDVARRVRTLVTIATPHRGTPLASFFRNLSGPRLLGSAARLLAKGLGKREIGPEDLPPDARAQLSKFLGEVGRDQALVAQLAPESMELFNATARDRIGVRYACVVARIEGSRLGVRGPISAANRAIFALMHQLSTKYGERSESGSTTRPSENGAEKRPEGSSTKNGMTDGVVPAESQVWGEILYTAAADHLDVLGHFDGGPTHVDWFASGSEFTRKDFEELWQRVYQVIEQAAASDRRKSAALRAKRRLAAIAVFATVALGSLALWVAH